ncbi:MAG: hypothetical protein ABWZ40_00365, partial [Caulobacterales bacterium]
MVQTAAATADDADHTLLAAIVDHSAVTGEAGEFPIASTRFGNRRVVCNRLRRRKMRQSPFKMATPFDSSAPPPQGQANDSV